MKRAFRIDTPFLFQESRFQADFFTPAFPEKLANERFLQIIISIRDSPESGASSSFRSLAIVLNVRFLNKKFRDYFPTVSLKLQITENELSFENFSFRDTKTGMKLSVFDILYVLH